MMISKVKPLHDKVVSTTSAVDNAEHKMATLDSKRKALEVRLKDLAKGFEDATVDKNDQEEKTVKMDKMLHTAGDLREVHSFNVLLAIINKILVKTGVICFLSFMHHNNNRSSYAGQLFGQSRRFFQIE